MSVFDKDLVEAFQIIKSDTPRLLKQHLAFMPSINLENYYYQKYTPLIEATYLDRFDMVKFICENVKARNTKYGITGPKYKAYLNHSTIDGKTALMVATLSNPHTQIIQYLLNEGANPFIKDIDNKDVFYYADYSITDNVEDFWIDYHNNLK